MKLVAFLALFALTANAFNMTAYHQGIDQGLGFNSTEIQADMTCLNALTSDAAQIVSLIQTETFDNIVLGLGELTEQAKTDLLVTCQPYWIAFGNYLMDNTDYQNLTEIVSQNFKQYYANIIKSIAFWASLIVQTGDDYAAGQTQAYIMQILWGIKQPFVKPAPVANQTVPFNVSEFSSEFFSEFFEAFNFEFGIQVPVNVSSFVECSYHVQNVTDIIGHVVKKFPKMNLEQRLDAIQYVINHIFETIRNCEGAGVQMLEAFEPVVLAFEEDPASVTLTVAEMIVNNLSFYENLIQQETVAIQEGQYSQAATLNVEIIANLFGSWLVTCTTTD